MVNIALSSLVKPDGNQRTQHLSQQPGFEPRPCEPRKYTSSSSSSSAVVSNRFPPPPPPPLSPSSISPSSSSSSSTTYSRSSTIQVQGEVGRDWGSNKASFTRTAEPPLSGHNSILIHVKLVMSGTFDFLTLRVKNTKIFR